MNLYAFELGRKKELCLAELYSAIGEDKLVEKTMDTAIFRLEELENPQKLQNSLGGTIKIIQILDLLDNGHNAEVSDRAHEIIEKHLLENFKDREGKIAFSVSFLSFLHPSRDHIKDILNFSKKILKSLGLNSRFVNKNFENVPSSTIYKARVLEKGVDICFIRGDKALYIGKTVGIQDLDAYTLRDYEKPCRDAKVGMLPPKLAQVMINMTVEGNRKKSLTIYDPFCGTGTILMEGLLMGFNSIGSDIDERMCEYSEKNCEWLGHHMTAQNPTDENENSLDKPLKGIFGRPGASASFRVFKKDAQTLTKPDLPEKVDAIITEGFLGNPMTRTPHPKEQQYIFDDIAELTFNWLRAVRDITPQNLKVTLCLPAFKFGPKTLHFPEFDRLAKEVGFKIVKSFTYDRPEQIVARDIKVLEKL